MRVYLVPRERSTLMVAILWEKMATQGHASTNVYTETVSIRNNLLGILIPQINIFGKKKLACYEWEPSEICNI